MQLFGESSATIQHFQISITYHSLSSHADMFAGSIYTSEKTTNKSKQQSHVQVRDKTYWIALDEPYLHTSSLEVAYNSQVITRGGTTRVVQLGKNNTTPRDKLYGGTWSIAPYCTTRVVPPLGDHIGVQ